MERGIGRGRHGDLPSCLAAPSSYSANILERKQRLSSCRGDLMPWTRRQAVPSSWGGSSGCESLLLASCGATRPPQECWQGDAVPTSPEGSASPGRAPCLPEQCCACLARRHGIGACSGAMGREGVGKVQAGCRQDCPSTRAQGIAHLGVM